MNARSSLSQAPARSDFKLSHRPTVPRWSSCGAVPEVAREHFAPGEALDVHRLRVFRHEVDGLVRPVRVRIALDVKNDALDGPLGGERDARAVRARSRTHRDLEPDFVARGEVDVLERLRPVGPAGDA